MPTIIDSLFLELGIDTSKFSTDQAKALAKISEFETRTKRAGKGGSDAIKTVSAAFRDLARDSGVGAGADRIESLAGKFKGLGQSLSVSGGIGAPLGAVARGIGAILSPTALWGAAIGGVGFGMWELNKVMTANNAAIERQAQLTGTSAENMWAWAEAAKTVGANPMEISGGIAGLQTAILGMGIGVGNASSQLIGLSRLGVPFDFKKGADIEALFTRVNALAAQKKFGDVEHGGQPLGALAALAQQAGMNEAMIALAFNPHTTPAEIKKWINERQGVNLGTTLQESLKSQEILGKLDIRTDILAETAYGGEQGLMQAVVQLLTKLLDLTNDIVTYLGKLYDAIPNAWKKVKDAVTGEVAAKAATAAATVAAEGMEGVATSAGASVGASITRGIRNKNPGNLKYAGQAGAIGQDAEGFAKFGSWADGMTAMRRQLELDYRRGETSVNSIISSWAPKGENDTGAYVKAVAKMLGVGANAVLNPALLGRLISAMVVQEQGVKVAAMIAAAAGSNASSQSSVSTAHTRIGDIHVHSNADTGVDMARDMRRELARQPLLNPLATQTMTLATRGSQ